MNLVILTGRLGKDPEQKTFENRGKLSVFSLATTEYYKTKEGERKEITSWHNIVARNALSDICQQMAQKGTLATVTGKINYREYEKDGVKHRVTEINADSVDFHAGLRPKKENNTSDDSPPPPPEYKDDLPF